MHVASPAHCLEIRITRRIRTVLFVAALFNAALLNATEPIPKPLQQQKSLREYRSQYLVVYTDLPEADAKPAIKSLERTLTFAARYWGQDPRGQIECYLLHDIGHVADADLPHRLSRVLVEGVGGATLSNLSRTRKSIRNSPIVVASTTPGVAEHEIVHAYCTQTFGFTGPGWYREGMAEMVVLNCTRDSGVVCTDQQLQLLRGSDQTTIAEVLTGGGFGVRIFESLNTMLVDPKNQDRQVPFSDWQQKDTDNVAGAREDYLRSWALCYMLLHNPNYATRFRLLGHRHVTTNDDVFLTVFAAMEKEVAFEYAFFLRNIGIGYRVDLCSWDWNKKNRALERGESLSTRVEAKKGYQASGLSVTTGQTYRYDAVGSWSTSAHSGATEANGNADQRGQLMGVIMNGFQLGEPFSLGNVGTFESKATGHLYLRCNDAWNEVHDNDGRVVVKFQSL